ncbi:transcriptional regulator, LacI family [Franzmannia pantelleriensis]|uniref:Transcriptional regulator, LacI family n=1 Tax=Franzmannia pantelleriensis TaxID=48727 RepID=A0A1G9IUS9_9GAMM|nr:substrate-binding domain-containing protein [Halomonas pantelleriensis]SDL28861.1 transcriptional regulator, LacI family [Halomonas pantelleriensis]
MSERATRPPTLNEVADVAGASKTSVSRYFGGERARLSPALQARIAAAASQLGFSPNLMARGLKGGHSKLIGMLVADIRNPFSVAVMHSVEQACRRHGYSLMLCNTDNDPAQERAHLDLLSAYRVEGLVINPAGSSQPALDALAAQRIPTVLLDRRLDHALADVVGLDNALAIDMALDHLEAQGYAQVFYLSEPVAQVSSREQRLARFHDGSRQRCLKEEVYHHSPDNAEAPLHAALDAFMQRAGPAPKAVLCANGNMTLAALRAFQALAIRPGDTGLMGIDELDWCALVDPGITTLAQPTKAIGHTAVDCLVKRLTNPTSATTDIQHPPTLLPRGSTQPPSPSRPFSSASLGH